MNTEVQCNLGGRELRITLGDPRWTRSRLRSGETLFALSPIIGASALAATAAHQDASGIIPALSRLGEFACVVVGRDRVLAAVDEHRSFPLFWSGREHQVLSDSVREVAPAPADGAVRADSAGVQQFRHLGYTLGDRTLLEAVSTIDTGTTMSFDDTGPSVHRTALLPTMERSVEEPGVAADLFDTALAGAVEDLLARHPDAQLVVPLSGGADSRLLLGHLVRAGAAQRILAFTYGTAASTETAVSRAIADALGVRWTGVLLDPAAIRTAWSRPGTANFLEAAWSGTSLPHIQDWYAIQSLLADGRITPGAIVLPGHSAVRTLKEREAVESSASTPEDLRTALLAHHARLRQFDGASAEQAPAVASWFEERIAAGEVETQAQREHLMQSINVSQRQGKYILNSVRTYDWAGLLWSMPLLSRSVHEVYAAFAPELTASRDWYLALTDDVTESVRRPGQEVPKLWSGTTRLGSAAGPLRIVLDRTRLLGTANAAHRRVTSLRHPMAFQAFAGRHRGRYAAEILRGTDPVGAFAQLFLEDRWHPGFSWRLGPR